MTWDDVLYSRVLCTVHYALHCRRWQGWGVRAFQGALRMDFVCVLAGGDVFHVFVLVGEEGGANKV